MAPSDIAQMKANLGIQLARLRDAHGWSQQQLISEGQVRTSRSTVANTETGRQLPDEKFWRECDHALNAEGALLHAYHTVAAAVQEQKEAQAADARRQLEEEQRAWSTPSPARAAFDTRTHLRDVNLTAEAQDRRDEQQAAVQSVTRGHAQHSPGDWRNIAEVGLAHQLRSGRLGEALTPQSNHSVDGLELDAAIAHLGEMWHSLVRADNLFGPHAALTSVSQQLSIIYGLLEHTREQQRFELLTLAAKYAESAAWLHEDTANLAQAETWTRQALEWATEAGDLAMVSWAMFRRSQQATTRQNGIQTISLARSARRNEAFLTGPARAAISQQEAHGYALEGDEINSQARLDQAHELSASPDTDRDGRTGHGDFCTAAYIEIQRANCWLTLNRADLAIPILEHAIPQAQIAFRRDRGQAQVRLSRAYSGVGRYDEAAIEVASALRTARDISSTRMLIEAASVAGTITSECDAPQVLELLEYEYSVSMAAIRGVTQCEIL
ncbi:helix-turn-helix transcriptional regulator [Glycomyces sp. NPDC047369]